MIARNWAIASDEELFATEVIIWSDEERAEFKEEREKRINAKRQEQERIDRAPPTLERY
jgi:hypothetical protein